MDEQEERHLHFQGGRRGKERKGEEWRGMERRKGEEEKDKKKKEQCAPLFPCAVFSARGKGRVSD